MGKHISFSVIVTLLFFGLLSSADAETLTIGSATGQPGGTVVLPVTVDTPGNIAAAAFTITYNSTYITLTDVQSTFFDTFAHQWNELEPVPDPLPPTEVTVDGTTYTQPLLYHTNGGSTMIAAARVKAGETQHTLFTLHFTLSDTIPAGSYPIGISASVISNTDAGYPSGGEAVPVLIGAVEGESDPQLAYPTINATLVGGSIHIIVDSDGDGIDDSWEMSHFGNLTTCDASSDYDRDGYSDYQEYLNSRDGITDSNGDQFDPTFANAANGNGYQEPIWQPLPGTSWQIQLTGTLDTSYDVDVYDIDLFDTTTDQISALHAAGRKVICYFSAGTREDWRPDAGDFPAAVLGNDLPEWPGEKWLDIRAISTLAPIMQARMDLAVSKGCDGVDPDNVDGFTNDTGFPLTAEDQRTYNIWLAEQAHARGLAIGLKNDLSQVTDLLPYFEWAVNEECHQYDECDTLMPFINDAKPVFSIEYVGDPASFCPDLNQRGFSALKRDTSLATALRVDCANYQAAYLLPQNTWRQISLPAPPPGGSNTVVDILGPGMHGDYGVNWYVFYFNPATNSYSAPQATDPLVQGRGYWIIQLGNQPAYLQMPAGVGTTALGHQEQCPSASGCYEIPLATRADAIQWSMLGHALEIATNWSRCRIVTDSGPCSDSDGCSPTEATSLGIFLNQLWRYNGSGYEAINDRDASLPWFGFWGATLAQAHGLNPVLLVPFK